MENLAEFYQQKVERFIKTVVCFDDMAYPRKKDEGKKRAIPAEDGFEDKSDATAPETAKVKETPPDDASGEFDARAITDAFASKDILCSVVAPDNEPESALVQIKNLMRAADVTILDWMLANHDTSIARRAISETLMDDKNHGGRLRLIVIYSLQSGKNVISELAEVLREHDFQLDDATLELQNENSLIVFLHKPEVLKPATDPVSPMQLPDRVIESFVKLACGLLPSAALTAISVLRDRTPQLLLTFSANLDGAFLAHRCLISDPNDAEQYFIDLIQSEIGMYLSHSSAREGVDVDRCNAWIDENENLANEEKDLLKSALTEYNKDKYKLFKPLYKPNKKYSSKTAKADKILKLLYKNKPDKMKKAKQELSFLSTIESCSSQNHRIALAPRLRLGSVIRDTSTENYLLCIQPLCDSVRILHETDTIFPFLILNVQDVEGQNKKLDLCIPCRDDDVVWLKALPSPKSLISYYFRGKSEREAFVEAERGEYGYLFKSGNQKKCFEWVADLKLGKAQRIASELAARIHTLGIDEFEWMRIHQS